MEMSDDGGNNAPLEQPEPDYAELFKEFVAQSVRVTLAEIPADALFLDEEVRQRVMHVLSFALNLVAVWPATRELLLKIAPQMEKAGHRDDWIPYLRRATQLSDQVQDENASADLYIQLGFLHQLRNRFNDAEACYHLSALRATAHGDLGKQARALNQQAFIAWMQGDGERAAQLANTALALLPETDVRQATGFVVLGWLAFDRQNLTVAETYFANALALWQAQGDQRQIARRLRDLANVRQLQKRDEAAITLYEQAMALFEKVNDPFEAAVTKMNFGIFFIQRHQCQEAIALFISAESTFRYLHDDLHLAINSNNLGIAYRDAGHYDQAIIAFERGIELCRSLNRTDWLVNMMDELGMTQVAAGNSVKAHELFQKALHHLQSVKKGSGYQYLSETLIAHLQLASSKICGGFG